MKFNTIFNNKRATKNHEGAKAYMLGPKEELYTTVVSSILSKSYYETENERLERIKSLVKQIAGEEPEFVAKLAVYARTMMNLRTVPVILAVELAKYSKGNGLVRRATEKVIRRADEITEMLAYYQMANGRAGTKKLNRLSKQLQKGIADAFNKFDEYQFAKYNRAAEIKLRDALFLVHPKAKDEEQQKLFDKIASDSLNVAYTWETELSKAGQEKEKTEAEKAENFKKTWENLIDSGKMGYMATLRNLRNILNYNVSANHVGKVAAYLANPYQVAKSKQFPFRFLSAYRELEQVQSGYTSILLDALEKAMMASAANIQGFDVNTRVVIGSDLSGSMSTRLSAKSSLQYVDVGLILAVLLNSRCRNVITGVFGHTYKTAQISNGNILANVAKLRQMDVGHATNGYLVIENLIKRKQEVDKVMIFTDCQLWNSNWGSSKTIEQSWNQYKKIAPNAKLYIFDLAGYGNSPLNTLRSDVTMIGGWSDKIFDVLHAVENGSTAIKEIEKIQI